MSTYTSTETLAIPNAGELHIQVAITSGTLTVTGPLASAGEVINTSGMYVLDVVRGDYTFTVSDTASYRLALIERGKSTVEENFRDAS